MDTPLRVRCVEGSGKALTEGFDYVVEKETWQFYHIIDDRGYLGGWHKGRFVPTEQALNTRTNEEVDVEWEVAPQPDIVAKPPHYTRFSIEPVTFIMKNGLRFEIGNIVKYACRAGHKVYDNQDATQSEITDLKKVIRYAEMRINQIEGKDVL